MKAQALKRDGIMYGLMAAIMFVTLLASVLVPTQASAAGCTSGTLIKASMPAVYYCGADGKRYVFPNEKTYFTWYGDFNSVIKISDADMGGIAIGGNATYKPGMKLVKIQSDPRTYAIGKGGVLRWIKSEAAAVCLYGSDWNKVDTHDLSDAFFVNYSVGAEINLCSDFSVSGESSGAVSINLDKGLTVGGGGSGTVSVSVVGPQTNATNVSADANITATFNQDLNASTFTNSTVTLTSASGTAVAGTVSASGNTVTFNPNANLEAGVSYTAKITTGAKTQSGAALLSDYSWSFTTGVSVTGLPTVVSTVPVSGSLAVVASSDITATFSETMNTSTLNSGTFVVLKGSTPVSGSVSYTGNTVTFNPDVNLDAGATYTAKVTTGAKDNQGNGLSSDHSWQFTVAAAI